MYRLGSGFGSVALSWLLAQESLAGDSLVKDSVEKVRDSGTHRILNPLETKKPHFNAKAKSCIFLIMEGGASQIDTFDPKPALEKVHRQKYVRKNLKQVSNQTRGNRYFVQSPFKFRNRGECGQPVSELFEAMGEHVDDLAFVRSVHCDSDNHPAAIYQYTTGYPRGGNPSLGAWAVHGLGTENENLPAYVVLRDGRPFGGTGCWGAGYLPAHTQGTQLRSGKHPILNLKLPPGVDFKRRRENIDLINKLNRTFNDRQPHNPELEARIAAYELAYRMQAEIPNTVDIDQESQATKELYGLNENHTRAFGQRCLLARRMIERGVRFVQVWAGGWDSHADLIGGHRNAARQVDRPIAGLLKDLKDRGLLDETLVVWGGEFGRTPDTTAANHKGKPGRDHNPGAMTMWFAGGGIKPGVSVGGTDEFGDRAVDKPYHLKDIHATFLHLLGLDQEKLTYYHGGRFKRLTDNGGKLIHEILA